MTNERAAEIAKTVDNLLKQACAAAKETRDPRAFVLDRLLKAPIVLREPGQPEREPAFE